MSDSPVPIPVPGSRVVSRVIDGRALLLDAGQDRIERLNDVGSFIWGLIRERRHGADALAAAVVAEFEVAEAEARADVQAFLDELEARGMVRYA
ncbi:MAG: PqqD family peptide modification chaperone [Myxococcales bacterium]|nr:PqqD family peptide modification chaperone [Myxococcales bacterium]